jgi:hypothetical protein
MIVCLQAPMALLAQEIGSVCLAPVPPDAALAHEVLQEYRLELVTEYEQYFRDISAYITSIDVERAAVVDEARAATTAYVTFLGVATKDENR